MRAQASGVSVWSGGGVWIGHQGAKQLAALAGHWAGAQHRRQEVGSAGQSGWTCRGGSEHRPGLGPSWAACPSPEPRSGGGGGSACWQCLRGTSGGPLLGGEGRASPTAPHPGCPPPSRPESWGVDAKTQPAGCASVPQRQCRSALNRKQLLLPAHPEGLGGVFLTHYTDYYSISEVTQWGPRDSHLQKALRALITKN